MVSPSMQFPGSPVLDDVRAGPEGETWSTFRNRLTPRFGVVWRDISVCYGMILVGLATHALVISSFGGFTGVLATVPAALWLGFQLNKLLAFVHEAVHYNIHWRRITNDRLANWLICPPFGQDIKHYRKVHWKHHIHLGDLQDPEASYRHPLTLLFLLRAVTGVELTHRLGRRRWLATGAGLRSLSIHGGIAAAAVVTGLYGVAAAWFLGLVAICPCLTMVQNMLQHRGADARSDVDYARVPHGPVNRMFESALFAWAFAAPGANRHLLHHWDPMVSYTRLAEMESFLMKTELAGLLDAARMTYFAMFRALWRRPDSVTAEGPRLKEPVAM